MLKVNKTVEPSFFTAFKKKNKPANWKDYEKYHEIKGKLKLHMLGEEQNNYCPYCERNIPSKEDGHIEHVRPRAKYPQEFQNYENLIVSCDANETCGKYKSNHFFDDFINPVEKDPKKFLTFDIYSGEIIPLQGKGESNYQNAARTIEILNLNGKSLLNQRVFFIEMLANMKQDYDENEFCENLRSFIENGQNFKTITELYLEN